MVTSFCKERFMSIGWPPFRYYHRVHLFLAPARVQMRPQQPSNNNNIKISVFERDFGHCCVYCVYFNGCASEGGIVCGCNKVKHLSPSLCTCERRAARGHSPPIAGHTRLLIYRRAALMKNESRRADECPAVQSTHKRRNFSDIYINFWKCWGLQFCVIMRFSHCTRK